MQGYAFKLVSAQSSSRPGAGPGVEGEQVRKGLCSQSFHSRAFPASVSVRSPGGMIKCIFPGANSGIPVCVFSKCSREILM